MQNNWKVFIVVSVVIIIVAGALVFASSLGKGEDKDTTASNDTSGTVAGANTGDDVTYDGAYIEKLAKYLTDQGMVFYGAYWCAHCKEQKKILGDAMKYIDYVECDPEGENANPDECSAQKIEAYPTWVYKGQKYQGAKSLAELAKITGFSDSSN